LVGNIKKNIWASLKKKGIRRIQTKKELEELINHRNITNYVKAQRLSWFGYVNRMPETSVVRKIYKWKPSTD